MTDNRPLILLILDGWGVREDAPDNAISNAATPNWDRLWAECPHSLLETSGEAVGLPAGQMGNSEVGHMNIGAGRIVYQELTRIGSAIEDGSFSANPVLAGAFSDLEAAGGTLHVMGLLSPGGVHSREDHLHATVRAAREAGIESIALHVFLDGRDVPPRSAGPSLEKLEALASQQPGVRIASVSGRYYAMDRDKRWDRTERAWRAIVDADSAVTAAGTREALADAYTRDEDDEFVTPTVIDGGRAVADGDAVVFVNFRADRARQLSQVFVDPDFDGFTPARRPDLAAFVTMTAYRDDLPARILFPPQRLNRLLGDELAAAGLKQLRIAETEKYAHVTYFMNGGREQACPGEERELIPSPKVATYDLQPEMSAPELAAALVRAVAGGDYDVIIGNVANPDMVGHSGDLAAAIKAVEAVDVLLGRVMSAVRSAGGELLVTADHGNVEQMQDPATGQSHTAHTVNPVPLVYLGRPANMAETGSLRDIAPTMLDLLGLPVPADMTGSPLIRHKSDRASAA